MSTKQCYDDPVTNPRGNPSPGITGIKVITVAEAAHAMRVSPMTIYRLIKSGELESVRVGRAFRIHEKSFEAYLKSHAGGI